MCWLEKKKYFHSRSCEQHGNIAMGKDILRYYVTDFLTQRNYKSLCAIMLLSISKRTKLFQSCRPTQHKSVF